MEYLGGRPTPAVGFAIGIERILALIQIDEDRREGFYLGVMLEEAKKEAFHLAFQKRKTSKLYFEPKPKSLKAHLKAADKHKARYAAIIGEDEYKTKKIWVKDLEQKEEKLFTLEEFMELR